MHSFSPQRLLVDRRSDRIDDIRPTLKSGVSSTSKDIERCASFLETNTHNHTRFAPYGDIVPEELLGIKRSRQHLYFLLHDENYSKTSMFILLFILALIILSTVFYVLETVPALSRTEKQRAF